MYENCSLFSLSVKSLKCQIIDTQFGSRDKIKFFALTYAAKRVLEVIATKR